MRYIYNSSKQHRCFHILDEYNELSLCYAEKGGVVLDTITKFMPDGRRVCQTCVNIATNPKKKKKRKKRKAKKKFSRNDDFYMSPEWRKLRYDVLKYYGRKCMCCGRNPGDHGIVLHVDHIKPRSTHRSLELDPENLQVLCEDCNLGKSNRDTIDYRPQICANCNQKLDPNCSEEKPCGRQRF